MDIVQKGKIDVFISRKSEDVQLAKAIYRFLSTKGLHVFDSDETLPIMGNSDYRKSIDLALDECRHIIVVGSKIENIMSSWVEAEWGFFISEKRAGRKTGNLITVITENLSIQELPPSLRTYEAIVFKADNFERIYAFTGGEFRPGPVKKTVRLATTRWLWPIIAIAFFLTVLSSYIYSNMKPFDLIIKVRSSTVGSINPEYPPFQNAGLVLKIGTRELRAPIGRDGQAIFRQIPSSCLGKRAEVIIEAKYYKSQQKLVKVSRDIEVGILPDGSLSHVFGTVRDQSGHTIAGANVYMEGKLITISGQNGDFSAQIPMSEQKEVYLLTALKSGYLVSEPYKYRPSSGRIDLPVIKK